MRDLLIVGNWKMHGNTIMISELVDEIIDGLDASSSCNLLLCSPFPYLGLVSQRIINSPISLGAQNLSQHTSGPYTGEVSAEMLKDMGCEYVIVGHSERRELMGETNKIIANKFITAIKSHLKPILCIGESLDERKQGMTTSVISDQLNTVLNEIDSNDLSNAVIAYEPVWAIGTGLTATPDEAQDVHAHIRAEINKSSKKVAENIQILYGGSVNGNNAGSLFSMPDIDGGLIGGASLTSLEFLSIAKATNK
tara:strand:- start:4659 stop:5414 length:756 start_codon:yes stop_codon:yes gene_type:complete